MITLTLNNEAKYESEYAIETEGQYPSEPRLSLRLPLETTDMVKFKKDFVKTNLGKINAQNKAGIKVTFEGYSIISAKDVILNDTESVLSVVLAKEVQEQN